MTGPIARAIASLTAALACFSLFDVGDRLALRALMAIVFGLLVYGIAAAAERRRRHRR
jgi:type IV secretory pathway VirB2 component (pilin)